MGEKDRGYPSEELLDPSIPVTRTFEMRGLPTKAIDQRGRIVDREWLQKLRGVFLSPADDKNEPSETARWFQELRGQAKKHKKTVIITTVVAGGTTALIFYIWRKRHNAGIGQGEDIEEFRKALEGEKPGSTT
ncbi:hypothetical protein HYT32_02570 [Candidatus Roizmanbacteria bacterium]|nr:hypothetical protein [Candidatus Roizmanbacteria bacterium]